MAATIHLLRWCGAGFRPAGHPLRRWSDPPGQRRGKTWITKYAHSSLTNRYNRSYGFTKADQTGTANHGSALDPWRPAHSRDSGGVPRKEPAGLLHRPDHRVPPGGQKGAEEGQKDQ